MSRLHNPEAQQLAELAALSAEGARLSRGRQYHRRDAVGALVVEPGLICAEVQGSSNAPYEVTIACREANENERIAAHDDICSSVPGVLDVAFVCHCPDWGDPCKHGIAAMLAFAAEVDDDAALLLRWRGIADVTPPAPAGTESLTAIEPDGVRPPGTAAPDDPQSDPPDEPDRDDGHPDQAAQDDALADDAGQDDALGQFFAGSMPTSSTQLIGPLEEIQLDVFAKVRMEIEGLDVAPVLDDAVEAIADYWLSR